MVSEREEQMRDDKELALIEEERLIKEKEKAEEQLKHDFEECEESLRAHSKLLSNWKDELRMETEKQIAIMRNVVREEARVDSLTIKLKELDDKQQDDKPYSR